MGCILSLRLILHFVLGRVEAVFTQKATDMDMVQLSKRGNDYSIHSRKVTKKIRAAADHVRLLGRGRAGSKSTTTFRGRRGGTKSAGPRD